MKKKNLLFHLYSFQTLGSFLAYLLTESALRFLFCFSSVYFPRCCFKNHLHISVLIFQSPWSATPIIPFLLSFYHAIHDLSFALNLGCDFFNCSSVVKWLLFSVSVRIVSHQCPPLTICFSSSFSLSIARSLDSNSML